MYDSRTNYCRLSQFGFLMDSAIPIRNSYIPICSGDTTRAYFMNIAINISESISSMDMAFP